MCPDELEELTIGGLHDFLIDVVLSRHAVSGGRAIDLGAGSGALAVRLQCLGFDVLACDLNPRAYKAATRFLPMDLNDAAFSAPFERFELVTAVEVIEHLEAPIAFLRNVAALLTDGGVAVVTTPNVDSLPARAKLLVKGVLRMFDSYGDPTHISPIFLDLLIRQYLPRAGLCLVEHHLYPDDNFRAGRNAYKHILRPLVPLLRKFNLHGDNHVVVLRRIR